GGGGGGRGMVFWAGRWKLPAGKNAPADRVAVAAEKFRERMHDDIGAVVDWLAQIGRGQGVVDDQRNSRVLGDLADRLDIGDDAAWIGDRLNENRLGLR